jgi:hypothetical protein
MRCAVGPGRTWPNSLVFVIFGESSADRRSAPSLAIQVRTMNSAEIECCLRTCQHCSSPQLAISVIRKELVAPWVADNVTTAAMCGTGPPAEFGGLAQMYAAVVRWVREDLADLRANAAAATLGTHAELTLDIVGDAVWLEVRSLSRQSSARRQAGMPCRP